MCARMAWDGTLRAPRWRRLGRGVGYRRVGAEFRHRGHLVNTKKVRRLIYAL